MLGKLRKGSDEMKTLRCIGLALVIVVMASMVTALTNTEEGDVITPSISALQYISQTLEK